MEEAAAAPAERQRQQRPSRVFRGSGAAALPTDLRSLGVDRGSGAAAAPHGFKISRSWSSVEMEEDSRMSSLAHEDVEEQIEAARDEDPNLEEKERSADHLQLVNNFTMLVLKIYSGYKEAWKPLKKRILRGKVPSLSSSLALVRFLNFLVGRISNEHRLRRRDWATGCSSQAAWLEHSCCWMLYFLALKGLALYSKNCSLIDALIFEKCSLKALRQLEGLLWHQASILTS